MVKLKLFYVWYTVIAIIFISKISNNGKVTYGVLFAVAIGFTIAELLIIMSNKYASYWKSKEK